MLRLGHEWSFRSLRIEERAEYARARENRRWHSVGGEKPSSRVPIFTRARVVRNLLKYTAISRKVVGKNVHATIPKGKMGYGQHTFPDTVAVEPTFVAFL